MRDVILCGMNRAESYGLTFRGPVRLYLELTLLFGSSCDADCQYPWAAEILANHEVGPQMQRAHWLYERSMDYRKNVAGPDDAYSIVALRRIASLARHPPNLSASSFVQDMLSFIEYCYPEKAAYVGNRGFETLIHQGMDKTKRRGLLSVRGTALVVVLMVAFGCDCDADPLYPWIGKTLNDDSTADTEVSALRLEKEALTWLDHALAYFDARIRA